MNKGTGLLGGILRKQRRAEVKVSINNDEVQDWEDEMLLRANDRGSCHAVARSCGDGIDGNRR